MSTVQQMSQYENSKLKSKKDLHVVRKVWHLAGVAIILLIFQSVPLLISQILAFILCCVFIPLDFRRLSHPDLNRLTQKIFGPVMRTRELDALSGMSYLFAGVLVLVLIFPADVVRLSLMFLGVADPLAAFVGQKWGREQLCAGKSLQGFLAAFVACTLITGFYLYYNNLVVERLLILAPLAGVSGAIAETLPIKRMDDNFTLPVLSAVALYILFYLFGVLSL